jgi:hypothetical protein
VLSGIIRCQVSGVRCQENKEDRTQKTEERGQEADCFLSSVI